MQEDDQRQRESASSLRSSFSRSLLREDARALPRISDCDSLSHSEGAAGVVHRKTFMKDWTGDNPLRRMRKNSSSTVTLGCAAFSIFTYPYTIDDRKIRTGERCCASNVGATKPHSQEWPRYLSLHRIEFSHKLFRLKPSRLADLRQFGSV
jgi:hypothetical protein